MSVNIFGSTGGGGGSSGADTKYVDKKFATLSTNLATKVNKAGDSVSGDLNIVLEKDNLRTFGVTDIKNEKTVSLLLGNIDNQIRHNFGHPIEIISSYGTKFVCTEGTICQLGSQTDSKAQFLTDIIMNDNCITNLHDPKTGQDAATKNYVDTKYIKNNVGFVPDLISNDKNKSGFIVSASSENQDKKAHNVFNSRKSEWYNVSDTEFWIQLQCPEPIRIHKFALRGNRANKLYNWKVQARNEYNVWDDLYLYIGYIVGLGENTYNNKFIDDTVSVFNVNSSMGYIYYKILVTYAEGETPGLSYWQLYTLDPILS